MNKEETELSVLKEIRSILRRLEIINLKAFSKMESLEDELKGLDENDE